MRSMFTKENSHYLLENKKKLVISATKLTKKQTLTKLWNIEILFLKHKDKKNCKLLITVERPDNGDIKSAIVWQLKTGSKVSEPVK